MILFVAITELAWPYGAHIYKVVHMVTRQNCVSLHQLFRLEEPAQVQDLPASRRHKDKQTYQRKPFDASVCRFCNRSLLSEKVALRNSCALCLTIGVSESHFSSLQVRHFFVDIVDKALYASQFNFCRTKFFNLSKCIIINGIGATSVD